MHIFGIHIELIIFAVGITLVLIGIAVGANTINYSIEQEHFRFLRNTVELGDFAVRPLRIDAPHSSQPTRDFMNVLSEVVPMVNDKRLPEVFITPKSSIYNTNDINAYKDKPVRFITNLYTVYLTILVRSEDDTVRPILTLRDAVAQSPRIKIYYADDTIRGILLTVMPKETVREYVQMSYDDVVNRKELEKGAIYVVWTHEHDPNMKRLGERMKYRIVDIDEEIPGILSKYPSLIYRGYDVMSQGSNNVRPIVSSYADKIAVWGIDLGELQTDPRVKKQTKEENAHRIYTLIKTLFRNIEYVRRHIADEYKILFQDFRPDTMIEISLVPYHDGVVRYFHETGVYAYGYQ